jgi:hypothetical protein
MVTVFKSGVEPANHANAREKEISPKNIIRVIRRQIFFLVYFCLFVSISG